MRRSNPCWALGIGALVFLAVPTGRATAQRPHLAGAWETFRLSPDGDQLFVHARLQTHRMPDPIEFRRIYDRTEP